jgi:predicted nucleic acid-binding protein
LIVIDASVVVDLLLGAKAAVRIADRILVPGETLHAPHLLDVEVAQVLRRHLLAADLDGRRGALALADLVELPIHRHPHGVLLQRAWELKRSISANDAMYLALAEALAAPLLTRDARLARSHGHRAVVEVL